MSKAVSNSDLNWLKSEVLTGGIKFDFQQSYRISSLVNAMITEPERVNYFYKTLDDEIYSDEDFNQCELMKIAFKKDEFCASLLKQNSEELFKYRTVPLSYGGFDFSLRMSCKYHLFIDSLGWGAGIRSTSATTEKEFLDSVMLFDYDRQRAVCMEISGANKDMIIGISKINYRIFKLPIVRGNALHRSGLEKMSELSFKWWLYYDNFGNKIS